MLLCLKDACFKIDKIVSVARAQTTIPKFEDEDDNNDVIVCNVLNVFLEGYATPITIFYDDIEERDESYTFAIECITDYYKG